MIPARLIPMLLTGKLGIVSTVVAEVDLFPGDTTFSQQGPGDATFSRQGPGDTTFSQQGPGNTTFAKKQS